MRGEHRNQMLKILYQCVQDSENEMAFQRDIAAILPWIQSTSFKSTALYEVAIYMFVYRWSTRICMKSFGLPAVQAHFEVASVDWIERRGLLFLQPFWNSCMFALSFME